MGSTIAVMITKGGVGKSTLVMALAETLSLFHRKRVLIVDSDSQSSVSSMLMPTRRLSQIQEGGRTLARFLTETVFEGRQADWRQYVVEGVSDVDDATTISLIPSQVQLALVDREVSARLRYSILARVIVSFLREAKDAFDLVLVDCPPALTALTEGWMQLADFHLSPTKPDYLGLHGLEILKRFEDLSDKTRFSERLGVVINMMDMTSPVDRKFQEVLMADRRYRCFARAIPDHPSVRHAALFDPGKRSFTAKYPGVGPALQRLVEEVLARLDAAVSLDQERDPAFGSRAG